MFYAMKHMDALREAPTCVLEDVYEQLDGLENMVRAYRLLALSVLDEREVGREKGAVDAGAGTA